MSAIPRNTIGDVLGFLECGVTFNQTNIDLAGEGLVKVLDKGRDDSLE